MLQNSQVFYGFKIIGEIFRDIIYFPAWWYARGLFLVIDKSIAFLSYQQNALALFVWAKNIFRPMYGQYDWQGRLISFFMRLVQIIFRGIIMIFWVFLILNLIGAWIALPILIVYEIIFQIGL